jgi:signal transduction histidine kinase
MASRGSVGGGLSLRDAMVDEGEVDQLTREELLERARALQTVLRVAGAVASAHNLDELAERFVEAVAAYTRFPAVIVLRYMPASDGYEIVAQHGFDESKFPPRTLLPAKGSLTGLAVDRREILTTDDIEHDDRVEPHVRAALTANEYTSGACVPVIHDDEVLGSFNLVYPRGTALGLTERRMLGALAASLSVAMAQRIAAARERDLETQARRAQQLESLGVLAGGIAHDFNNLLSGIVGNIDLARMFAEEARDDRGAKLLSDALAAASRAAALVTQLLTFSRGGAPSRKATTELGETIREVATFACRGTSVLCEIDVAEPLGVAELDLGQIGQVIQNLVLNACQASPSGATVTVRARREARDAEGEWIVMEVVDAGRGIAPENLARVFEPFFTNRPGGTGLGLAVSHSIVRRHGGRLSVKSEIGRGTHVVVELPGTNAQLDVVPPISETPHHGRFSGRALVMDDDRIVRDIAVLLLEQLGFEVSAARHGAEALALAGRAAAEARPFRVGLLDLTIVGGLGGGEIADDLRRVNPGIRLIVSTGYAPEGAEDRFDGRLNKPYELEQLARALEGVLPER